MRRVLEDELGKLGKGEELTKISPARFAWSASTGECIHKHPLPLSQQSRRRFHKTRKPKRKHLQYSVVISMKLPVHTQPLFMILLYNASSATTTPSQKRDDLTEGQKIWKQGKEPMRKKGNSGKAKQQWKRGRKSWLSAKKATVSRVLQREVSGTGAYIERRAQILWLDEAQRWFGNIMPPY